MRSLHTAVRIDPVVNHDGARALERLLTVCSDGVEGYRRAAKAVRASDIRSVLQRNEVEREEIASVVTNALVELGAKGGHGGSVAGAAHRDLLAALGATHADAAIVHECVRGDQLTLGAFAEALSHELPAEIRARIAAQQGRVVHALERLTGLSLGASTSGDRAAASASGIARTIAEIMNPKLLFIAAGDPVALARSQIVKFGVTAVPVLDECHRPVGVVSLRDFARDDQAVEPSADVHMIRSDASVDDGARALAKLDVHHLVVVDAHGVAVGMVSALDFVRASIGAPPHHPAPFDRF